MMIIMEPHGQRQTRSVAEGQALYDRMLAYAEELKQRGVCKLAQSLVSDAQGVRVEVRDGKRKLVDGPFAEAKEMVGGVFLLDCATREEALAIAGECPAAEWAAIEVRETGPCWVDGTN